MTTETLEQLAESRGRTLDEAVAWITDAFIRSSPTAAHPERDWTDAESLVLRDEGIDVGPLGADEPDVTAETARRYLMLLADGLSVNEAADVIGVNPSRVRQLLGEHRLYGLRPQGRSWVLPRWQFTNSGVVPSLHRVLALIDRGLHPLTITGFFESPQPELVVNGQPVSPLAWLRSGASPDDVEALAEGFDAP